MIRASHGRLTLRAGFTLIELLVVITIIGLLMALIFPAFSGFIDAAQRTRCANNIGQLANFVHLYANAKNGAYPPYAAPIPINQKGAGQRQQDVSWHVLLLPTINEPAWQALRSGQIDRPPNNQVFMCPIGTSTAQVASMNSIANYVANCGLPDLPVAGQKPSADTRETAVFHRGGPQGVVFRSHQFPDGAERTIMFSENLQTFPYWNPGKPVDEANVGIVFHPNSGTGAVTNPQSRMINADRDKPIAAPDYDYARPSSNHHGGVMVAWCSGGAYFLSDRVDYYDVYCKLMTPDGGNGRYPGAAPSVLDRLVTPFEETLMTNPQ